MFSGMQGNCTSSGLVRPSIFDSRSLPALVSLASRSESFPNRMPRFLRRRHASDANPKEFHQPLCAKRDAFNHVLELTQPSGFRCGTPQKSRHLTRANDPHSAAHIKIHEIMNRTPQSCCEGAQLCGIKVDQCPFCILNSLSLSIHLLGNSVYISFDMCGAITSCNNNCSF
jgi:hypothetical protein